MRSVKSLLYKMKIVRYVKVEVYLRSGQVVKLKCKEWEAEGADPKSWVGGLQSYSFKGVKNNAVWFDIGEVVAIKGES